MPRGIRSVRGRRRECSTAYVRNVRGVHLGVSYGQRTRAPRGFTVEQVAITDARDDLAEVVNRVTYRGERVVLTRRGKRVVAVVPLADLELLERLEDAADLEEVR